MGEVHPSIPFELVRRLQAAGELRHAVETGTYLGDGAAALAEAFPHVTTIELDPRLAGQARARFAAGGVDVVEGASRDVLRTLCPRLDTPTLFWLDGHWSGPGTAGEDDECPVLDEVAAIDLAPVAAACIVLIDDARLFLGPPPPPHRREMWPTIAEVFDVLRANHPRYVTIVEDVVIATPPELRDVVERYSLERRG